MEYAEQIKKTAERNRLSASVSFTGITKDLQLIEHTAEQPFYKMSYYCVVENAVTEKVYIIETDYNTKLVETMLLASEY